MSLADRYRRWYEYEQDCNAKVLASLEAVALPLRTASGYQQALDLLAHMVAARLLWLFRLGVAAKGPDDIFPQGVALADLALRIAEVEAQWSSYLERLDDQELARRFEYRSLEGARYHNTIEDVLTQLFGHAWYHRGQIAQLIRGLGAEPATTDFVFWTRQALPD